MAATALVVSAGLAGTSGAATDDDDVESAAQALAVVNAGGGTFRRNGDDSFRLTLTQVAPRAVWFSEQPSRDVGVYSIDELEDAFFTDDAPNAALDIFANGASAEIVIVELANPRYQPQAGRYVLDARILEREDVQDTVLEGRAERATADPPRRFGAAALFIDDGTASCPAAYWGSSNGAINSMSNVDCLLAQSVIAQASKQHPTNTGADQYEYDFTFFNETWHAIDQTDQASFDRIDSPDNPNARQSFYWRECREVYGNEYC